MLCGSCLCLIASLEPKHAHGDTHTFAHKHTHTCTRTHASHTHTPAHTLTRAHTRPQLVSTVAETELAVTQSRPPVSPSALSHYLASLRNARKALARARETLAGHMAEWDDVYNTSTGRHLLVGADAVRTLHQTRATIAGMGTIAFLGVAGLGAYDGWREEHSILRLVSRLNAFPRSVPEVARVLNSLLFCTWGPTLLYNGYLRVCVPYSHICSRTPHSHHIGARGVSGLHCAGRHGAGLSIA